MKAPKYIKKDHCEKCLILLKCSIEENGEERNYIMEKSHEYNGKKYCLKCYGWRKHWYDVLKDNCVTCGENIKKSDNKEKALKYYNRYGNYCAKCNAEAGKSKNRDNDLIKELLQIKCN